MDSVGVSKEQRVIFVVSGYLVIVDIRIFVWFGIWMARTVNVENLSKDYENCL